MKAKDIFQLSLGTIITFGFFFVIYLLFWRESPPANKELLLIMLGVLAAKFGDVVAYNFNSSKSSSDKTEMIHNSTPIKNE